MCGIYALINKSNNTNTNVLDLGTKIIRHRGPDDEGFYLWSENVNQIFCSSETSESTLLAKNYSFIPSDISWKIGLGHRRLSIIDLSPGGHQPMKHYETGLVITFNGEVYNYKEIREELVALGHKFYSQSDTEVILCAWAQWGQECLHRFNGMFAFVIFDPRKQTVYAVRDRFGVKPVYWYQDENYFGIASEPKQFRTLPGFNDSVSQEIAYQYLAYGRLDFDENTFYKNIKQIRGGEILTYSIPQHQFGIKKWYQLPLYNKFEGSEKQAIDKFRELFSESVKLRLRSDVTVGSCLSGGLDSSAIVCTMAEILNEQDNHNGIKTITACFENKKYDEWEFAKAVIDKTNSQYHQVFPSFENLQDELSKLMWHMDEPFGSTSQYSQWAVFKGAASQGLKVMLDGQGSDEQLGGYNGNELPMYAGLISKAKYAQVWREAKAFEEQTGVFPKSQILGAILRVYPSLKGLMPSSLKSAGTDKPKPWINYLNYQNYRLDSPSTLQETLAQQTLFTSLPMLLRYEDRNSMAWSIESRVPFMDYRLVEFNMSLPEKFLHNKGVRKYILREAMRPVFPAKIYERKDKMGFVTPEEVWLKGQGKDWLYDTIHTSMNKVPELFNKNLTLSAVDDMVKGTQKFDFSFWRMSCLGLWVDMNNK